MRKIKEKLITSAMTFMLGITAVVGFGSAAQAANTADWTYSYNSGNASATSVFRDKTNTTKVYVNPRSGPAIKYAVYGKNVTTGDVTVRSTYHKIPLNVQASITNSVYEKGDRQAALRFTRVRKEWEGVA